jgi:hypothetical protein
MAGVLSEMGPGRLAMGPGLEPPALAGMEPEEEPRFPVS